MKKTYIEYLRELRTLPKKRPQKPLGNILVEPDKPKPPKTDGAAAELEYDDSCLS